MRRFSTGSLAQVKEMDTDLSFSSAYICDKLNSVELKYVFDDTVLATF